MHRRRSGHVVGLMLALGFLMTGWASFADAATDPVRVVLCGVVDANTISSGEGSGPGTLVLRVTSMPGAQTVIFGTAPAVVPPAIGTYICGQFAQGAPMSSLVALLGPGDPGYLARAPAICGTLQALAAPNPRSPGGGVIEGAGSVTIAGRTYRLSSALPSDPGKNVIGLDVVVGRRVCLTGDPTGGDPGFRREMHAAEREPHVIPNHAHDWTLAPARRGEGQEATCSGCWLEARVITDSIPSRPRWHYR